MTFPPQWATGAGLQLPSGRRSMRFYIEGTATANYADNAYIFSLHGMTPGVSGLMVPTQPTVRAGGEVASGNPATPAITSPMGGTTPQAAVVAAYAFRIYNDGTDPLEFSFDGVHLHGVVMGGKEALYRQRYEPGICVRGRDSTTPTFRIEAW